MVERKHRHILEVARAIRFQGNIPITFWGECVLDAIYLINMMPTGTLHGKLPYEVFHKSKPALDHLRTMGCLCYAAKPVKDDKFSPRSDPCIMIEYSYTQKGYVLYNLSLKRFMVNRDVVFRKDVFPFKEVTDRHVPLLRKQSLYGYDDDMSHSFTMTDTLDISQVHGQTDHIAEEFVTDAANLEVQQPRIHIEEEVSEILPQANTDHTTNTEVEQIAAPGLEFPQEQFIHLYG